jgi:hypothetical protein
MAEGHGTDGHPLHHTVMNLLDLVARYEKQLQNRQTIALFKFSHFFVGCESRLLIIFLRGSRIQQQKLREGGIFLSCLFIAINNKFTKLIGYINLFCKNDRKG